MNRRQQGMATVEFALVGAMALLLLIACIEISRALFVWNSLAEGTRRAARVATVCPVNDPAIAGNVLMTATSTADRSQYLHGLARSNVLVEYLSSTGAVTTALDQMQYVRVSVTGYQFQSLIPGFASTLDAPAFSTTLPVESLGYVPGSSTRQCLGV